MAPRKTNKVAPPPTRVLRKTTVEKRLSRVARALASPKPPKPENESPTRLAIRIPPAASRKIRDIPVVAPSTARRSPSPILSTPANSIQAMPRSPPREMNGLDSAAFFVYPPPPPLDPEDPEWLDVMYRELEKSRRSQEKEINQLWEDMTAVCAQVNLAAYELALEQEKFDGYLEIIESIAGPEVVQHLLVLVKEDMLEPAGEYEEQGSDDEGPAREERPRGYSTRDKGKGRAMDYDRAGEASPQYDDEVNSQGAYEGKGRVMDWLQMHGYQTEPPRRHKRGREAKEDTPDPNFEGDEGSERASKRRREETHEDSFYDSSSLSSRRSQMHESQAEPTRRHKRGREEEEDTPDPNFEDDEGSERASKRRREETHEDSFSDSSSLSSRHRSNSPFVLSSLSPRSKLRRERGELDSEPDWRPSPPSGSDDLYM